MKTFAFTFLVASISAFSGFAGSPTAECTYQVFDIGNGNHLLDGRVSLPFQVPTAIDLSSVSQRLKSLKVTFDEARVSPDTYISYVRAEGLPKRAYFNAGAVIGVGATFGDGRIFGQIRCDDPFLN